MNKTIEEILGELASVYGADMKYPNDSIYEAKRAITQHLLDVVERAKPGKNNHKHKMFEDSRVEAYADGYDLAIDQFHQNIIKELADE